MGTRLECEQAALNCHIVKTLAVKYKITDHRPWHVALLSAKVLNSLEETVTIAEGSLLWGGTIQWAIPFNRGTPSG